MTEPGVRTHPGPSPDPDDRPRRSLTRRAALGAAAAGSLALLGGAAGWRLLGRTGDTPPAVDRQAVAAAEAARSHTGTVRAVTLTPRRSQVDLGGRVVEALAYGDTVPGPTVRVTAGDVLRLRVDNRLDRSTSVHWHGVALRHDADGVPGVTGPAIPAGGSTSVDFVVPDPGTYWFHPHVGLQLDWGLYGPLVVDDPHEPGAYDDELVVVLDDWTVGIGSTPEAIMEDLLTNAVAMGGHGGMGGGGGGGMGGRGMGGRGMGAAGDVDYPAYLANGRLPEAPAGYTGKPGRRVRLRMINAAADTTFDVAVPGRRLQVTHTDGFPVVPVHVDTLQLSMGERYDAVVTLPDGATPLVAVPTGKPGTPARILLRAGSGAVPPADLVPQEILTGRRLTLADLRAVESVRLPERTPDTVQDVVLGGDMSGYRWTINGRTYDQARPLQVRQGQTTRLRLANASMMLHPVHLHGHTFAVRTGGDARKDTIVVPPMGRLLVDVRADNPGNWMLHCHNAFHMEAGMMTRLDYAT